MNKVIERLEMEPGSAWAGGRCVAVARSSRGVLRYFLDGVRVDRLGLLTLLCDRHECAHRKRALERFHAFTEATTTPAPLRLRPRPWASIRGDSGVGVGEPKGATLMTPVMLGDEIELRPAVYPCRVVCPMNAHPSVLQTMPGYDAFHRGRYVAGGTVAKGAETRPLIATVLGARRHLREMLHPAG